MSQPEDTTNAPSLRGKRVLITGASDGIGLLTAKALAAEGAILLLHGRDREKLSRAAEGLHAELLIADLSDLRQVRALADRLAAGPPLDVLVNNAGVGVGPKESSGPQARELSHDGFELRWAVNFLAPFALSHWLLAAKQKPAIVNVASAAQAAVNFADVMLEQNYTGMQAYAQSKLALVAWSFALAERQPDLAVNVLHPGSLLDTKMVQETFGYALGPAESGAEAVITVIRHSLAGHSGRYYDVQQEAQVHPQAQDPEARARIVALAVAAVAPFSGSAG